MQLTGNRCHDNQQIGIVFFSSQGQAINNECWGNKSGIILQRSIYSLDQPSEVQLTGNRCHDNQESGIVFFSSQGQVDNNECWGNSVGISLQRDPNSPDQPSEAQLTGNRCHDNQQSGIIFFSSLGRADNNECWENSVGISLLRDSNSPDQPSEAQLTGNRCHDNQDTGIIFASSQGQVDNNECWGNSVGISLLRGSDSPDQPSEAQLTGNRCHDNQQAGIIFFSSQGQVDNNECWGNKSGIALQRDSDSPDQPSDVQLTGNRCHDNQQVGIVFSSSLGRADNNECWGNFENTIIKINQPFDDKSIGPPCNAPNDPTHKTVSSVTINQLIDERIQIRDDSILIGDLQQQNIEPAEKLADFFKTGCACCINSFLDIQPDYISTDSKEINFNNSSNVRLYQVSSHEKTSSYSNIHTTEIHRISSLTNTTNMIQDGTDRSVMSCETIQHDIVSNVIKHQFTKSAVERGKIWSIALISEDNQVFDNWLELLNQQSYLNQHAKNFEIQNGIRCKTPVVIDFALYQQKKQTDKIIDGSGYQTLLNRTLLDISQDQTQYNASINRHRSNLLKAMPMWGYLALILFWTCALCFMCVVLTDYKIWYAMLSEDKFWHHFKGSILNLELNQQLIEQLQASGRFLIHHLSKLGGKQFITFMIGLITLRVLYCSVLNLLLPQVLHVELFGSSIVKQDFAAELGWLKALYQIKNTHFIQKFLAFFEEAAWKRWVKLQLFGRWWHAPELIIIALKEARFLTEADKQGLQMLFTLKRPSQSLLLITHTSGVSHLVNCYLDVCIPKQQNIEKFSVDEKYIIHQPGELTFETLSQDNSKDNLQLLAELLGWPDETDDNTSRHQPKLNSLINSIWVEQDILAALVFGSTAYTQMTVAKEDIDDLRQYEKEFTEELRPYDQLFPNQKPLNLESQKIREIFAYATRAKALISTVKSFQGKHYLFILGRSGERKRLATALMPHFPDPKQAVNYLAYSISCGEIFNLNQVIHSVKNSDWPGHRLPSAFELPVYMEASLFLLKERLSFSENLDLTKSYWLELQAQLENTAYQHGIEETEAKAYASRSYLILLKGLEILGLLDDNVLEFIEKNILDKTLHGIHIQRSEHYSVKALFIEDLSRTVQSLFLLDKASALKLINSKLTSDWFHAPERLKHFISDIVSKAYDFRINKFLQVQDEEQLFKVIQIFKHPTLCISTLVWLALQYINFQYIDDEKQYKQLKLANFINTFKSFLVEMNTPIETILPPARFDISSCKLIFDLLTSEGFADKLMSVLLKEKEQIVKNQQQIMALSTMQLEGIAWGSYSQANNLITKLEEDIHELDFLRDS